MRDKIRQWLVDHPRTLDMAFGLVLGYSYLEGSGVSPMEGSASLHGP